MSDPTLKNRRRSRRLWVVTELYFPEETSTGYYMTRIAEGLTADFDVHAVAGFPNYLYKGEKAPGFEIRDDVSIHRLRATRFDKNSIPLKALNMLTFSIAVLIFALRRFQRGDRVLVVTTPPILPFFVALAALLKGVGMTLLVHDTYPEILSASGKVNTRSPLFSFLQSAKNWIYKMAEGIIVVGRDMESLARKQTAGLDSRITWISNWAELETVFPDKDSATNFRTKHGLEEKFVILYAGNMGYPNDLETIVLAAEKLKSEKTVQFVFLGAGAKLRWLKERIESHSLTNVTILDPRPRTEQNEFLNGCDIGIVSLVDRMKGVSVPSRTYNLLAAGKPILGIVDPESEVGFVIRENEVGFLIRHGHPEDLVDAVMTGLKNPETLAEMGRKGRELALRNFNQESALEEYRRFLS
jgi:colanic acid biosynthesis glycosyl transferase WcaI